MFITFDRLPEKKQLNFRKFENCRNCSILMSGASVVLRVMLSQSWMLLQNSAEGWNSLGYWHLNLWAAELGKCYSNVYGKISFAPLNILSSVIRPPCLYSVDAMYNICLQWSMMFENVDARIADLCLYYKLTCKPSAQVSSLLARPPLSLTQHHRLTQVKLERERKKEKRHLPPILSASKHYQDTHLL